MISVPPWPQHNGIRVVSRDPIGSLISVQPDGCWRWTGSFDSYAYGKLSARKHDGTPTTLRAHRVIYESFRGKLPGSSHLRHKCDNRFCVNPDHLVPGDQMQNMSDMIERGRAPDRRGSRNGRSKLTEQDVSSIRRRHGSGETIAALAAEHGVHRSTVEFIINRTRWKHVP